MRRSYLKKIISCVLCVAVLLANMPLVVRASGDGEDVGAVTTSIFSWQDLVPQTPAEGNVMAGFSGAYYVESAEKILNRINEIRLEACQEGIKDPHTEKALTEADYKPLKWSSDLEAIARLRAAEASFKHGHERPNGERCYSIVTTNNEQTWAENLAWNYTGIMEGIEQWYEEKADWVSGNTSAVTGHYESLISTRYNHMAIGCFGLSSGGWYAVAQEFSDKSGLDESQDTSSGECVQDVELPMSYLKSIGIGDSDTVSVQVGTTNELVLNTVVSVDNYYGNDQRYNCVISNGATWTSSDTSVATVDASGMVAALQPGTTTIQATVGSLTDTITVSVQGEGESPMMIQLPTKTTYKVGEELDLAGGKITVVQSGEIVDMTADMVSGFRSTTAGLCTVTVKYGGYTGSFDTLIVAQPTGITAQYGQTVSQLALPTNEYGVYSWLTPNALLEEAGAQKIKVNFMPTDTQKFQNVSDLDAEVDVYCNLETYGNISLTEKTLIYNGLEQKPAVTVTVGKTELQESDDYVVSYANNKNVGTATITVSGLGYYQGSKTIDFTIQQANLMIKAKDMRIQVGEQLPDFEYEITGLAEGETLVKEPDYTCLVSNFDKAGEYEIVPYGASASDNYNPDITYVNGKLTISEDKMTITEIADMTYTGKACKPSVQVYDDGTLLKVNKDYKITYHNNVNANKDLKIGDGIGTNFNENLPYVQIEGKGNYSETLLKINFNILPAVIGTGGSEAAKGFTLKVNSQLVVNGGKALNPFVSIKDSKALKKDKDYTVQLFAQNAYDGQGEQVKSGAVMAGGVIPAGYSGDFQLVISGLGNYSGSICTEICVADKSHLIKNASIKIGKNLKKMPFSANGVTLTPAYLDGVSGKYYAVESGKVTDKEVNADDVFTVSFGKTCLIYQKDYTVRYRNNTGAGKATMTIVGKGKYAGSKSATFQIVGEVFSAKYVQIQGLENQTYTGNAILQNQVKLTYVDKNGAKKPLEYGKHYTISYKNNVKKGTATMTFTAISASGYQGKFSKSFKILAADVKAMVQSDSMKNIIVEYEKAGATPIEFVQLTNPSGKALVYKSDYTISYRNNKLVGKSTDSVAPTMVIKGKGNYTGTLEVPFTITQGDLSSNRITKVSAFVQFKADKDSDAVYKANVTVMDGKMRLSAGKDYTIVYVNNTQEKCALYLEKFKKGTATHEDMPKAIITAVEGSNYKVTTPIEVPLAIYETKLSNKNLHVVVSNAAYTGHQVKPAVSVYYHENPQIVAQARGLTDEAKIRALGLQKLSAGVDYSLSYGNNVTAGKNKGSVKISGVSPLYGGSVTVKFTISGKKIVW